MQFCFENITKLQHQLSAAQPIFGYCNLHPQPRRLAWDMHYGLEFGLCCAGRERRFFCDKSERDAEPGDVWFCGMWEPHGSRVVAAPCETITLVIWPPLLAQMHFPEASDFNALAPFNAPPKQRPRTPEKMKAIMLASGRRLKSILIAAAPHQPIRLRFALQEILLNIMEFWPEKAAWTQAVPPRAFPQINRALEIVFNSRTYISTTQAARACGMSRHAFGALFQSWMNIGFADFSIRHRLHQAAARLRDTSEPIKAIAQQWGFADASHFHRLFLKHFGFSPADYRSQKSDR